MPPITHANADTARQLRSLAVPLQSLCCPYPDHGALEQVSDTAVRCETCRRGFQAIDGRLILLDEARSIFSSAEVSSRADERQFPENTGWRYVARRLFPASASRDTAFELLTAYLPAGATPNVLVIGCGTSGRRYSTLLPQATLFLTDVTLQGDAEIGCDGECLPFRDESLDCVIIDQVLEHALHPAGIVDEIHRCLKPNGIVYSGVPFYMPVHGYPFDFQRYTPLGHRMLFRRFEELALRITQGPLSALSLTMVAFLAGLSNSLWWRRGSSLLVRVVIGPLLRLDRYATSVTAARLPVASAFVGRKSRRAVTLLDVLAAWNARTITEPPRQR